MQSNQNSFKNIGKIKLNGNNLLSISKEINKSLKERPASKYSKRRIDFLNKSTNERTVIDKKDISRNNKIKFKKIITEVNQNQNDTLKMSMNDDTTNFQHFETELSNHEDLLLSKSQNKTNSVQKLKNAILGPLAKKKNDNGINHIITRCLDLSGQIFSFEKTFMRSQHSKENNINNNKSINPRGELGVVREKFQNEQESIETVCDNKNVQTETNTPTISNLFKKFSGTKIKINKLSKILSNTNHSQIEGNNSEYNMKDNFNLNINKTNFSPTKILTNQRLNTTNNDNKNNLYSKNNNDTFISNKNDKEPVLSKSIFSFEIGLNTNKSILKPIIKKSSIKNSLQESFSLNPKNIKTNLNVLANHKLIIKRENEISLYKKKRTITLQELIEDKKPNTDINTYNTNINNETFCLISKTSVSPIKTTNDKLFPRNYQYMTNL